VLVATAFGVKGRLSDELGGAWWIGFLDEARLGKAADVVFATRFHLASPAPNARLLVRAVGTGRILVDGAQLAAGTGAGAFALPFAAGDHEILVALHHPTGVAALRLRLETPERVVVTGPGWRVDDDVKRMEGKGFGGARYPATLWARPPVSSLDSSSSRSSWRGSAVISSAPSSSRMPSRAATE
jgi:hypothetical protein